MKKVPVIISNRLIGLLDLIKGTSLNGFAGFYFFIVLRGGLSPLKIRQKTVHEQTHIDRMREMGYFKWIWKYLTDKNFKAEEEKAAKTAEYNAR